MNSAELQSLHVKLKLPDRWQQLAIQALQDGLDVVVQAPTGAGKTYIFELLVEAGLKKQAVYTVPTRALANDKMLEWRRRNWNVGITTGDLTENPEAPVVVATLETQKHRMLRGEGPALLVIDEYQMLGDRNRGVNYEMVLALAREGNQLLLMSGSVGNPESVADWLRRIGRDVVHVCSKERPVPLVEVYAEALPNRIPSTVKGFWPRIIARALKSEMAPLLAFAPRRRAAEKLAVQLARMLPEEDPLILTSEQKRLAGDVLSRLLKARIAYHHSGLDYHQRAGLIEPLAKAGQLRVVVATMGLASGINFSMRSVIVTDREYRSGDGTHLVRPDELVQMFGRAGRRGLDKKGFIIVAPGKPRLNEARPLILKRTNQVDWPSMISVMNEAILKGNDPVKAVQEVARRLFSPQRVPLGLDGFRPMRLADLEARRRTRKQEITEIQNPDGTWERRRAPQKRPLRDALIFTKNKWCPALASSEMLEQIDAGVICKIRKNGRGFIFGREVPLARLGRDDNEGDLVLTRWSTRILNEYRQRVQHGRTEPVRKRQWTLDALESELSPVIPFYTHGGRVCEMVERGGVFYGRLDYSEAEVLAHIDSEGRALIHPPTRTRSLEVDLGFLDPANDPRPASARTPADAWYHLGLIDERAHPTRRGLVFSFYNHGEGLAVAAALEDESYPIKDLIFDLANLRAGHRFGSHQNASSRLGSVCRQTFRDADFEGYLRKGLPLDYGDGASEIIAEITKRPSERHKWMNEELLSGDIERAHLEWRSILNQTARAPDLAWSRWQDLKALAQRIAANMAPTVNLDSLPPLTSEQQQRHKSFLRFD